MQSTYKTQKKLQDKPSLRVFISLIIPAIFLLLLIFITIFLFQQIVNDATRRLARQYSIEAASNFRVAIDPNFTLMKQVSRSTTISRWMSNPNNLDFQQMAFEEIAGYYIFAPSPTLIFTIYAYQIRYDFSYTSQFENWAGTSYLYGAEISQWFFDTMESESYFILNLQNDTVADKDTILLWASHRMYYQGTFVGVVSVGFPFETIFDQVFKTPIELDMHGFIIDENGYIRYDSSRLIQTIDPYTFTHAFAPIPALDQNPLFAYVLEQHLSSIVDGIFVMRDYSIDAVPMENHIYRYAGISPIIGTSWSLIIFSNHVDAFGGHGNLFFAALGLVALLLAGMWIGYTNKSKQTEIAKQSNEAKSRFLARMSHEIRTPITSVIGLSQIELRSPHLSEKNEKAFTQIYNSATVLLNIINRILDISKIEAGKMELINEEYEIASMISYISHTGIGYLFDKKIDFKLSVDPALPKILLGDATQIEQILLNLLSNAFKYTEKGSVKITFNHRKINEKTIDLILIIEDTGLGMSAENLQSLLENDYVRLHERDLKNISGTGLGISIVTSLVDMMNGKIDIQSQVGVGTNITISIPQAIVTSDPIGTHFAQSLQRMETQIDKKMFKMDIEPMPYGKVLVVDDVPSNIYVAKGMLEFYNLQIDIAESGKIAIEKIKQGNSYDIIFLDHMMPELNGTETLKIIRDIGYTKPVVSFTANALKEQSYDFEKEGFDGFISKPIQIEELNNLLIKFVRDQHPEDVVKQAKYKQDQNNTIKSNLNNFVNDNHIKEKLEQEFMKDYKTHLTGIISALEKSDTQTAQFLCHNLKSIAYLIKANQLGQAADQLEKTLGNNEKPTEAMLHDLTNHFNQTRNSITEIVTQTEKTETSSDKTKTIELLTELEPLLQSNNAQAAIIANQLEKNKQTDILIKLIESFEFEAALLVLDILKNEPISKNINI